MAQKREAAPGSYRPLYLQVKAGLVRKLLSGEWQPGALLPSEARLAAELGVSQGTLRSALTAMEEENLIVRRQGVGTFVAEYSEENALLRFFRVTDDAGRRPRPQSRVLRHEEAVVLPEAAAALELPEREPLQVTLRLRSLDGRPVLLDRIHVRASRFPGLGAAPAEEATDQRYVLYQRRFGVTIVRTREQLRAVLPDPLDLEHLGVAPGTPLLQIRRTAYDLEGWPTELRVSHCHTEGVHYEAALE